MDQPWQLNKTFQETNDYMLAYEILCDITFLAGECKTPVKAHKYILASRSPVFYAMFCGLIFESGDTVDIPDIHPNMLRHLLRYIYAEKCHIGEENVMDLLYCAKKYHVLGLERECKTFIEECLCPENACSILPQAISFDEQDLIEKCKQLIIVYPSRSMKSEGFENLPKETVKEFLATNELIDIDEVQVYNACKSWAEKQCEEQDLEKSPENLRECLGDILNLIRFPAMTQENFANHVTGDGILSDKEIISIYEHYAVNKGLENFISEKRMLDVSKLLKVERFSEESCNTVSKKFCNIEYADCIDFTTNKNTYLVGVSLTMPVGSPDFTCKLKLFSVENKRREIIWSNHVVLKNNKNKFEDLMFEKPVYIHKNKAYIMVVLGSYGTPSGIMMCKFCQQVFLGDKCNKANCGRGRAWTNVYWGKDCKTSVEVEDFRMNFPKDTKLNPANVNESTGLLCSFHMTPARF